MGLAYKEGEGDVKMKNLLKKIFKTVQNQKGFTLVENILTTTILGVGLMAGMMTMQNSLAHTVTGDMNTVATQKANEKIELIMADKSFVNYEYISSNSYGSETLDDSYNMTRTVTVTEVNAEDLTTPEVSSGLKKVVVTVSWGSSATEQVVVSTLIADYE